jgi:hypothetical protein
VEEMEGTRRGFMEETVGDYSRKCNVEEIDSTKRGFMEETVGTTVERAMWKKEMAP